jgi:hypothetical protein
MYCQTLVSAKKRFYFNTLCAGRKGGVGSNNVNFSWCSFQICTQVKAKKLSMFLYHRIGTWSDWLSELLVGSWMTSPSMRIMDVFLMNWPFRIIPFRDKSWAKFQWVDEMCRNRYPAWHEMIMPPLGDRTLRPITKWTKFSDDFWERAIRI